MSDIPKLLPLEYCTIERAAKMLRCEVEDIKHWIDINVITAYAIFDGSQNYLSILTSFVSQTLKEDEPINSPEPLKIKGSADTITLSDGSELKSLPFSFDGLISDYNSYFYGVPTGFWRLLNGKSFTEEDVNFYTFYPESFELSEDGELDCLKSTIVSLHLEEDQLPNLYILYKDLKHLHETIYGENKPLKKTLNDAEKAQEQAKNNQRAKVAKPHHKTITAEKKYTEILDFAVEVLLKDRASEKPEITSATKWAYNVDQKAPIKYKETGEVPLCGRRLQNLLSPVYKAIQKSS